MLLTTIGKSFRIFISFKKVYGDGCKQRAGKSGTGTDFLVASRAIDAFKKSGSDPNREETKIGV
jgi:hypothetical protein